MRRAMMLCAAVLCLTMTLAPTALAAGADEVEVADLHLVCSCGQGCGGQCHRQAQHSGA